MKARIMTLALDLDVARLVADLNTLATQSRALKLVLTTTWTRPMRDEQKELARVRRRTTELCILRAFLRGRLHVSTKPRDLEEWDREAWHRTIAERAAKDYALAAASAPAQGAAS